MEFSLKNYKVFKTKNYLKTNNFFFFFNTINQNSSNWRIFEQKLKSLNLSYYNIFNKITNNILKKSIYSNKHILNGITILIKPTKTQSKQNLTNNFETLLITLLAIKLNNKIYTFTNFKNCNSIEYKENNLALCQFTTLNLKFYFRNNAI